MREAIPPLPQYAFMTWCSTKAQGKLYLPHLSHDAKFNKMLTLLYFTAQGTDETTSYPLV
jgi:hypothetical protein